MSTRAGTSLVECVVAIVLLATGLAGATATLLTAQRLHRSASRADRATRLASGALDRFLAAPCPTRDSAWTRRRLDGLGERWAIRVSDSVATLDGVITLDARPEAPRIPVVVRRRCLA